MQTARVAIVGGGLSGLYAASLLERKGIKDYVLLEARDAVGGRIASAVLQTGSAPEGIDRFDLGPTWFWPGYQPKLDRLVDDLGLQRFEQFEVGDMMVERSSHGPPMRMRGYLTSPVSMRLVGGMGALIDALRHRVDAERIHVGQAVRRLRATAGHVELDCEDDSARSSTWRVDHVFLATPPRLVEESLDFTPPLPSALARQWRATPTWMASHAKYVAIYDAAFWREQGLSGEGRSAQGPLGEIHDASMPGGRAALFGFLGVPARVRRGVPEDVLRAHCRAQLVRLFGPRAATPMAEALKDWALERYTASADDLDDAGHHPDAPPATAASDPWSGRLTGIASEWSRQFPGYVAGAIDAATSGVEALFGWATQEDDLALNLGR